MLQLSGCISNSEHSKGFERSAHEMPCGLSGCRMGFVEQEFGTIILTRANKLRG